MYGVIGSSTGTDWNKLCARVEAIVPQGCALVSGGAAWGDHVAVHLYLTREHTLTLHLPCPWENGRYQDMSSRDWRTNPGRLANQRHELFQRQTGIDSLQQIQSAIDRGAQVCIHSGFHARNTEIAKVKVLVASGCLKGGTLDTWKKCKGEKIFVG